ncbi:MAG: formylglycine-generating enzyme family protein [Xenococcus sp. MO_188.B8]|nr:formylglycine-generating enzyme family protein [Xenococcus sp. MO_188.B8]
MIAIPGGKFLMGTKDQEIERLCKKYKKYNVEYFRREKPQHEVTVQPFFMSIFLVTQGQWKAIASLPKVKRDLKPDPSKFKGDNLPVENISWFDAVEFCQRLSKQTVQEYRLPTEAEWEYACRAGTTTPFHFGETITSDLANYRGTSTYANEPSGEYRQKTTPVGSFPPNAFGLYDMHGNVWEWCQDGWHENYQGAPKDSSAWLSQKSSRKVLRGGSWNYIPRNCRSAYRDWVNPGSTYNYGGFRVACGGART